jgi:hypothetical protein
MKIRCAGTGLSISGVGFWRFGERVGEAGHAAAKTAADPYFEVELFALTLTS